MSSIMLKSWDFFCKYAQYHELLASELLISPNVVPYITVMEILVYAKQISFLT